MIKCLLPATAIIIFLFSPIYYIFLNSAYTEESRISKEAVDILTRAWQATFEVVIAVRGDNVR